MKLAGALALVRSCGLLPFTDFPGLGTSFVRAVAGDVKGSWWGHPKGSEIFNLSRALLDSEEEVLSVKLLGGRETLVHRRLWPMVLRLATDRAQRRRSMRRLSPEARRLLRVVYRRGEVRLDVLAEERRLDKAERRALSRARAELERSLLALSREEHGEKGNHVTVLSRWDLWATPALNAEASAMTFGDARSVFLKAIAALVPKRRTSARKRRDA